MMLWGFRKIVGTPSHHHIHFNGNFHEMNHPAIGDSPLMATHSRPEALLRVDRGSARGVRADTQRFQAKLLRGLNVFHHFKAS